VRLNLASSAPTEDGDPGHESNEAGPFADDQLRQAYLEADHADRLANEANPKAKRMRALAHLRVGELDRAIEQAGLALNLGDMQTINHLVLAIAKARKGNRLMANDHLTAAESTWPRDLKEGEFVATYDEGILWFESAAELRRLRDEARALLGGYMP
jgi:tetratricopeptide (TPR) repeat protein